MCKVNLSVEGYASNEQFLNTWILNHRKVSFTERDILSVAQNAGIRDEAAVKMVLHKLGKRGLVVRVGNKYYTKSVARRGISKRVI